MKRCLTLVLLLSAGCSLDLDRLRRGGDAGRADGAVEAGPDAASDAASDAPIGCMCAHTGPYEPAYDVPIVAPTSGTLTFTDLADFDGDGLRDILAATSDGAVHIARSTSTLVDGCENVTHTAASAFPLGASEIDAALVAPPGTPGGPYLFVAGTDFVNEDLYAVVWDSPRLAVVPPPVRVVGAAGPRWIENATPPGATFLGAIVDGASGAVQMFRSGITIAGRSDVPPNVASVASATAGGQTVMTFGYASAIRVYQVQGVSLVSVGAIPLALASGELLTPLGGDRLVYSDGSAHVGIADLLNYEETLTFPVSGAVVALATGQLTGAGEPEIVVAESSPSAVTIYQLAGSGMPTLLQALPMTTRISTLALADVDGDGELEIYVGTPNDGLLHVYQRACARP